MHITFGRRSRLTALGAGLIAAAALAVSAAGPALADTVDTGGSASLAIPDTLLVGLAKSAIIVLPETPVTSSDAAGADTYTLPVTGGNGEVSNFYGTLDLGGSINVTDAATGKSVAITGIQLNFFTGALTGIFPGATHHTTLAYLNGDMSESSSAGPPATETFSCDELDLSLKAATALNTGLATKAFKRGTSIGAFTTTYDVTIS
jgi:hypothetical protein